MYDTHAVFRLDRSLQVSSQEHAAHEALQRAAPYGGDGAASDRREAGTEEPIEGVVREDGGDGASPGTLGKNPRGEHQHGTWRERMTWVNVILKWLCLRFRLC